MSDWKDDFQEAVGLFHENGKPRRWVLVVIVSLAVTVGLLFVLRSLGSSPVTPIPEPTTVETPAPTDSEPSLGSIIQTSVNVEWRRAAIPSCVESFTTGVPRGSAESDFLALLETSLQLDGLTVSRGGETITVNRANTNGSSVATITVRNLAAIVCVN